VPASFVPPTPIRQLRDLTRTRVRLVEERAAVANRIQRILENANIKLASVATDVLGYSGRRMLEAMIEGQTNVEQLADLARTTLRRKIQQLRLALYGSLNQHHRFWLRQMMDHLEFLEGKIFVLSRRSIGAADLTRARLLCGSRFRASGVCSPQLWAPRSASMWSSSPVPRTWRPGRDSALATMGAGGKRKSGKTPKGNAWLRRALCEAAWGESYEEHLPRRSVPSPGCQTWSQTSHNSGGAHYSGHRLPHAQERVPIPGTRRRLL
jgi:transposase